MKKILGITLIMILTAAGVSLAKEKNYQQGTVVSMSTVPCGAHGGAGWNRTNDLLCQEYVIHSADMEYRIRQPKQKHAELMPIGAHPEFFVDKDVMKLHVNGKKFEYLITGMTALSAAPSAAPK